ncbi:MULTISPECIES: FadR/GntR family transcriptional regulator [Pseudonocardia]|uniref:FadR/GntR family transcriptional regulator n=1 Tax=Pseudonocardia TaxID=1847 RepID=UPI000E334D3C|nr:MULTISPECIES: GntR family transcriptional regulator [Pseudonocardia]TDN73379.1 GntR family transcriptional regulator [Pseudonocardia autotrophica]BBG04117.1 GntR family transcriptional regulator [Pseudonocardia autotrophica]
MRGRTSTTQRSRVTSQLLRQIRGGRFNVGDRLPSERILAEEFGVSRPVIREALGTLGAMDIIESQAGRGSFLMSTEVPDSDGEINVVGLIDVVSFREVLEAGALALAGTMPDLDADLVVDAMDRLKDDVAAERNTIESDIALHRAILASVRSPMLLRAFDDSHEAILRSVQLSPHASTMGSDLLALHEAIAAGITARSTESALAATHRMHDEHRSLLRRLLGA